MSALGSARAEAEADGGGMTSHGFTVWFTGLSGAGKSTIAGLVVRSLRERGVRRVEILDGDEVRETLSAGSGFSKADRDANIRRIAHVARLLARNGVVTLVAAISPYRAVREEARRIVGRCLEVYVEAPIDVLAARDPKGLYRRALAGEIPHFTGISDPYEPPARPDLVCRTDRETAPESAARVVERLAALGWLIVDDSGRASADERDGMSAADEAAILERLVRLGYLG